jgi:membrane protease YdiL (CAAX protease family)
VFAPVFEELIYRGPLFLTRRLKKSFLWWSMGVGLSVLFALSHGRNGLALMPLIILGICSLWLISTTHRFWPCLDITAHPACSNQCHQVTDSVVE